MRKMKKTRRPLLLTVNGKAEAVLRDASAYQEVARHLDAVASVRGGLAQAGRGEGRPADGVFDELDRKDRSVK
jgi:PHD/YefM family antitoxin component YafN of YafNO toxin-antitoxin module